MTITEQRRTPVNHPDLDQTWELYSSIFAEIDTLAVQRHLMTYAEFADVYKNPDVLKFYAYGDAGELVGMSVLTQHLPAWPLISPRYFQRHWPEHFARQAIWYVGFVGCLPNQSHGFRTLIADMYPHVIGNDGVAVMDFCTYNILERRLPEVTLKLLNRLNPAAGMQTADTQSFILYRFDGATS